MTERQKTRRQPRYRELAEWLMLEIRQGRLRVGEKIPGELELVESHKVSRHTVREALRVLEELGLIDRQPGLGTVVRARQSSPAYVQSVATPAELMQYPAESKMALIENEVIKANRALAKTLKCRSGSVWTRLGAVRKIRKSGLPICWSDIYVIPEYASVAERIGRSRRPVYEIIEREFDEQIRRVEVDIRAGLIDEKLAKALGVAPNSASLILIRRYIGRGGRLFEVSVTEHPAQNFNYTLQLERGWQTGTGWSPSP